MVSELLPINTWWWIAVTMNTFKKHWDKWLNTQPKRTKNQRQCKQSRITVCRWAMPEWWPLTNCTGNLNNSFERENYKNCGGQIRDLSKCKQPNGKTKGQDPATTRTKPCLSPVVLNMSTFLASDSSLTKLPSYCELWTAGCQFVVVLL